jgi:hypothetical protein
MGCASQLFNFKSPTDPTGDAERSVKRLSVQWIAARIEEWKAEENGFRLASLRRMRAHAVSDTPASMPLRKSFERHEENGGGVPRLSQPLRLHGTDQAATIRWV